ncbi:MAG: PHB depolymerase family esterase [Polyangiaceae bacterium]
MRNVLPLVVLVACSSSSPASTAQPVGLGDFDPMPFGGARAVSLYVPTAYTGDKVVPLVVMLHGYSVSGGLEEIFLRLKPEAEKRGFLYAYPNGTTDKAGNRFWNATDGCCDMDASGIDDSAYLTSLVAEIGTRYKVDPKRVFFIGHSNGGFMSYRMACDHAGLVAAVVSLAGATYADTTKCKPTEPVAVLQIHGTKDTEVLYDGNPTAPGIYPGAKSTVEDWATYDGCALTADSSAPPIDLDESLPGAETQVVRYTSGCKPGGHAELWSIEGGQHIPGLGASFAPDVIDFLFAHPKP